MLTSIVVFLRRLIGLEKDFHRIVQPITKVVDELEALAERERQRAQTNDEKAARLLAEAEQRRFEADKARSFSAGLLSGDARQIAKKAA